MYKNNRVSVNILRDNSHNSDFAKLIIFYKLNILIKKAISLELNHYVSKYECQISLFSLFDRLTDLL